MTMGQTDRHANGRPHFPGEIGLVCSHQKPKTDLGGGVPVNEVITRASPFWSSCSFFTVKPASWEVEQELLDCAVSPQYAVRVAADKVVSLIHDPETGCIGGKVVNKHSYGQAPNSTRLPLGWVKGSLMTPQTHGQTLRQADRHLHKTDRQTDI